jgi:hypothetical protein
MALQIGALSNNQEDSRKLHGLPQAPNTAEYTFAEIDLEIVKQQTELLSEKICKKLQNKSKINT